MSNCNYGILILFFAPVIIAQMVDATRVVGDLTFPQNEHLEDFSSTGTPPTITIPQALLIERQMQANSKLNS